MCSNDVQLYPIKSKWCMFLDLLMHAICAHIFKVETVICVKVVHSLMCEVAIVLQSKPIKLYRGFTTKSYNRPCVFIAFPGFW